MFYNIYFMALEQVTTIITIIISLTSIEVGYLSMHWCICNKGNHVNVLNSDAANIRLLIFIFQWLSVFLNCRCISHTFHKKNGSKHFMHHHKSFLREARVFDRLPFCSWDVMNGCKPCSGLKDYLWLRAISVDSLHPDIRNKIEISENSVVSCTVCCSVSLTMGQLNHRKQTLYSIYFVCSTSVQLS